MAAATDYELGASLLTMDTLGNLGIVNPQSDHRDYSRRIETGSGIVKGLGYPVVTWYYKYLDASQYDALKTFCAGDGAAVYIATVDNNRTFVRYACNMQMQEKFTIRNDKYLDVTVTFTHCVLAE